MPGITIAAGPRASDALGTAALDSYERRTYGANADGLRLSVLAYAAYPIAAIEDVWGTAVFEGAAYGPPRSEIESALASLGRRFAADPAAAREEAERWAGGLDGDFVIAVVARDGRSALVVNDRLGRLPLYWASKDGNVALAREVKAVRAACGAGDVDRIALAQTLLFSFPLGHRTLHSHIARVPEASSVVIGAAGDVDIRPYYRWNFEALATGTPPGGAAALAERFVERCSAQAAWCGSRPIVLGLSGGLDSRAVAAALSRSNVRYSCVTFASRRKKTAEEIDTSVRIARTLGVDWEEYALEAPSWNDARNMARLRDGSSNIALAFLWEYFSRLVAQHGPDVRHFTGDGGDRAMPDLRAEVPIRSLDRFLAYRLSNALWRVDEVAGLVGLDEREIVDAVRTRFETYPERDASFYNVRFMIAEWAFCRLFGGEDRNRAFVWSMTPFYCQSFFEAAMRAPVDSKRHYRLYADFLRAIDARMTTIAKSNWGYSVTSPLVRILAWRDAASSAILSSLRGRLRSGARSPKHHRFGTPAHDPEFAALARSHQGSTFEPSALHALTERGIDKLQYHMLATVLLYAHDVWGDSTVGS
jgi:asparagine synthase (glutamine-hydrolysing)